MRAAILARVSTGRQADESRTSLPFQRDAMMKFAEKRGWDVVSTFEIPGESAAKWNAAERPQFQRAIEAALRGEFDALIVYDVSRFARNQAVLHESRRLLREANVSLWSVVGEFDAVADGLQAGIFGAVAEHFSNAQGEKIRNAFSERHKDGRHVGPPPFGYRRDGGLLVANPEEAEAVRYGFVMRANGAGYVEIANRWNALGLPPHSWRGKSFWSGSSVQAVITNRTYLGEASHHGEWIEGQHEPIVPREQWLAAQEVVARRSHQAKAPWLLSGIATCVHCGGALWQSLSGKENGIRYYRDAAKARRIDCPTAGGICRAEEAEEKAGLIISSLALDERWIQDVYRDAKKLLDQPVTVDFQKLREERDRVTEVYMGGDISREKWRARLAAIDERLALAPPQAASILDVTERFRSVAGTWQGAKTPWRREVLRTIFTSVPIEMGTGRLWVAPRDQEVRWHLNHRREWLVQVTGNQRYLRLAQSGFEFRELVAA